MKFPDPIRLYLAIYDFEPQIMLTAVF